MSFLVMPINAVLNYLVSAFFQGAAPLPKEF